MSKHRLRFSKEGRAIYISHLDLMRTFQRAFMRAGLSVKHTEGYNPHAYVSVVLPLSLGTSSQCELLDFELLEGSVTLQQIPELLNMALPEGMVIQSAYEGGKKPGLVKYVSCKAVLEYDGGVPRGGLEALRGLFAADEIIIEKKTKKGIGPMDIKPAIKSLEVTERDGELEIAAVLSAQNPALSPDNLVSAVRQLLPELAPSFAYSHRIETYDENMEVFR